MQLGAPPWQHIGAIDTPWQQPQPSLQLLQQPQPQQQTPHQAQQLQQPQHQPAPHERPSPRPSTLSQHISQHMSPQDARQRVSQHSPKSQRVFPQDAPQRKEQQSPLLHAKQHLEPSRLSHKKIGVNHPSVQLGPFVPRVAHFPPIMLHNLVSLRLFEAPSAMQNVMNVQSLTKPSEIKCLAPAFQKYKIDGYIGHGAYAIVVRVREKSGQNNQPLAMKVCQKEPLRQCGMLSQLMLECNIHKQCSGHQNIISLIEFAETDDCMFMLLEHATFGTLRNYAFQGTQRNRYCALRNVERECYASHWFTQVCMALMFLHSRSVIHRDVKLDNILLCAPQGKTVKLCDFGWAVYVHGRPCNKCGTEVLNAPEVGDGIPQTPAVDMWSLGACALEVILIRNFNDQLRREIPYLGLSPEAISFLDGLLQANPQERPCAESTLNHPFCARCQLQVPQVPRVRVNQPPLKQRLPERRYHPELPLGYQTPVGPLLPQPTGPNCHPGNTAPWPRWDAPLDSTKHLDIYSGEGSLSERKNSKSSGCGPDGGPSQAHTDTIPEEQNCSTPPLNGREEIVRRTPLPPTNPILSPWKSHFQTYDRSRSVIPRLDMEIKMFPILARPSPRRPVSVPPRSQQVPVPLSSLVRRATGEWQTSFREKAPISANGVLARPSLPLP
eukprot:GEMP01008059.1.p1 GENE.GEMP01008059.1~~GEMP01008059.1.p1  ORF type:complete len:666 (+),score=99.53 GEMP01008059.1:64-2061(+)